MLAGTGARGGRCAEGKRGKRCTQQQSSVEPGSDSSSEAQMGWWCCFQEPSPWWTESQEAVYQWHHPQWFPPQIFAQVRSIDNRGFERHMNKLHLYWKQIFNVFCSIRIELFIVCSSNNHVTELYNKSCNWLLLATTNLSCAVMSLDLTILIVQQCARTRRHRE